MSNTEAVQPEKTRYSDEELVEFKELIEKKLDKARKELDDLLDSLRSNNDSGGDDAFSTNKLMDENSLSVEKEHMTQMAERQRKFIKNLEDAFQRIQNKTYGICKESGKLISKERLRAVPHTTLSIEAKMKSK
jgi:RNA polymerase-binding protein DksA